MQHIDAASYKESMKFLTGAVTLVTTSGLAGKGGFTATAVCSVSDAPPTLLVCMNKSNELASIIPENGFFGINIMPKGSEELANIFAGMTQLPTRERLQHGDWVAETVTGVPLLANSLSSFECRVAGVTTQATHLIVFGEVVATSIAKESLQPLVYFNRGYYTTGQ